MRLPMIFPGQASQYVGMGKDYYDSFESARNLYREANSKLGFDITELSFSGDLEELTKTKNAQPAILLHSLAILSVLNHHGINPSIVAGHSLGEFSALVAAGFFRPLDALLIVRRRGELMFEAGLKRPGTMAAIIGMSKEDLENCIRKASSNGLVVIANYNSYHQFAISGEVGAVEAAIEIARENGAKRAIMLNVSGAFHSPLMEESTEELIRYIKRFDHGKLEVRWIANVSGGEVKERELVMGLLQKQLTSPVRWVDCMKKLACSIDSQSVVLEVGPGKVLTGLAKRINDSLKVQPLSSTDQLKDINLSEA